MITDSCCVEFYLLLLNSINVLGCLIAVVWSQAAGPGTASIASPRIVNDENSTMLLVALRVPAAAAAYSSDIHKFLRTSSLSALALAMRVGALVPCSICSFNRPELHGNSYRESFRCKMMLASQLWLFACLEVAP